MLSFHEWLAQNANQQQAEDSATEENMETPPPEEPEITEEIPNEAMNEASEKIHRLCRVCSSNGLISINSSFDRFTMKHFKPSGDKQLWEIKIGKIIEQVSGENVNC